ncbi:MAG TPA: hypothetical protein DCF33_18610 [Saprospirales bacterium]|nr:hypothetical protein [Saprospirales bacterium]
MKKLLTPLFIVIILNIVYTQSFWERANGPNGLNVSKLYYSPQGEVYARDFNDRTFRSLNNGLSWQEIYGPEPGVDILNLRVGYKGTLFCVGADWITRYRSTDFGTTWIATTIPAYYIAFTEAADGACLALSETELLRSYDYVHWDTLSVTLNEWYQEHYSADLGWLPNGTLVASENVCYYPSEPNYFMISKDNGMTWDSVPGSGPIARIGYVGNETYIFSAKSSCNRVYKTSPDSTAPSLFPENILNTDDHRYLVTPTGALIVGNCDSTRISYDAGNSWQNHDGNICFNFINHVMPGNLILAGRTFGGHIMRSTDEGKSWTFSGYGVNDFWAFDLTFKGSDKAFALTSAGIWRTLDGGVSWHIVPNDLLSNHPEVDVYNLQIAPNGDLYVCRPQQLLRSTDDGETFQEVGPDLPSKPFSRVSIHPETGDVYLSGDSVLLKTTDQGQSWQLINDQTSFYYQSPVFHPSGTMYAIKFDPVEWNFYLIRSDDGGVSWQTMPNMVGSNYQVRMVQIAFDGKIVASNSFSIFISTDNGLTWVKRNVPMHLSKLTLNAAGHIFIGEGSSKKIYQSENAGQSWTLLENLPSTLYTGTVDLSVDPSQRLWVCTDGDGYFRSVGPTVQTIQPILTPDKLELFPNPAKGGFWIKGLPTIEDNSYTVQLTDLLGRKVFSQSMSSEPSFITIPGHIRGLYLVEVYNNGRMVGAGKVYLE